MGDAVKQRRAVPPAGVAIGAIKLRPGIAGGDVDGGVLPDRTLRAGQAADEEAVDAGRISAELAREKWGGLQIS
jgi:hypothetical protein